MHKLGPLHRRAPRQTTRQCMHTTNTVSVQNPVWLLSTILHQSFKHHAKYTQVGLQLMSLHIVQCSWLLAPYDPFSNSASTLIGLCRLRRQSIYMILPECLHILCASSLAPLALALVSTWIPFHCVIALSRSFRHLIYACTYSQ